MTKRKTKTKPKVNKFKTITVNNRTVVVKLDKQGIMRTPNNLVLRDLVDTNVINLNEVVKNYRTGEMSVDKYLDLMLNIGYSVSGLEDSFDSDNMFSNHNKKIKLKANFRD